MQINHHSNLSVSVHRDLRRYPRVLYSVPISLHTVVAGVTHTFHGISVDISQGGLGALVSGGPRVGETVQIELSVGQHLLCTGAIVRHRSQMSSGFEFVGLTAEDRSRIQSIAGKA